MVKCAKRRQSISWTPQLRFHACPSVVAACWGQSPRRENLVRNTQRTNCKTLQHKNTAIFIKASFFISQAYSGPASHIFPEDTSYLRGNPACISPLLCLQHPRPHFAEAGVWPWCTLARLALARQHGKVYGSPGSTARASCYAGHKQRVEAGFFLPHRE